MCVTTTFLVRVQQGIFVTFHTTGVKNNHINSLKQSTNLSGKQHDVFHDVSEFLALN